MDIIPNVINAVLNSMMGMFNGALNLAIPVVAGMVLLVAGGVLSYHLRHLVMYLLGQVKFDHYMDKLYAGPLLHRLGMGRSSTRVAGFLAFWGLFLAFFIPAADVLGLAVVADYLAEVMAFMPKLLAAVLIMAGGLLLGHFFSHLVHEAALANGIGEAHLLAKVPYYAMVVFSGILALDRLGVTMVFLTEHMVIILGAIGLGLALAYGFGRKGGEAARHKVPLRIVKTKSA